jgi:alkaline phosphatase
MLTHSLTSVVTDSSAAATTWSTGRKIVNQQVCQFPDGTPLTSILHLAQDRGMGTGLITTARITHATPAAWWARIGNRDREGDIAVQYLDSGMDVLLGGGEEFFLADDRSDGRDLFAEFQGKGYQLLRTREELLRATGDRLLGVFTRGHVAYEIDRLYQNVPSPSLAEMTGKGLELLDGKDAGFVLQVEVGRVDHGNHENDPGSVLHEILAGDEALRVILDYADRTPGTLVIMGSDHATGGGVVYGRGPNYRLSTEALQEVTRQRASYAHLLRHLGADPTSEDVAAASFELLGVRLNQTDLESLTAVVRREERLGHRWSHSSQPHNSVHQVLSQATVAGPNTLATPRQGWGSIPGAGLRLNVNYSSGTHTAGLVPVALYGSGVPTTGLGIVDNTELFDLMLGALGISFQNPLMSEEAALDVMRTAALELRESDRPHWV